MADTSFVNGVTLTDADWFNDVNRLHYTIFGDPANVNSAGYNLINGATAEAAPATGDYALIVDTSAGSARKVLLSDLLALVTVASTGDVKLTLKTTADSGWVMCNDGTIGNAASSGTTRANADTENLFTLLWNNVSDTYAPVSGGRGASAAADFAANKTIGLTKMLGRSLGVAGAGAGLTSRVLGLTTGSEDAIVVTHNHGVTDGGHVHGSTEYVIYGTGSGETRSSRLAGSYGTYGTINSNSATTGVSVNNAGSSGTGANMQPTSFLNAMIKL